MKRAALIIALAAALAMPLLTSSNYLIGIAISAFVFLVPTTALNLIYGYAGLLSFAQLGFWGIGGYAAAIAVVDYGFSFLGGVAVAGLINAAIAFLIGLPLVRTKRHAFVVATLTFALLCGLIARDWISMTRGPLGIPGLPAPRILGYTFASNVSFYYLAFGFMCLAVAFLYALSTSRFGLILKAIKDNEPLTQAQGTTPLFYKLGAFIVTAALTGMAGGIFAFRLSIVDPLFLDFYYIQTFLISVIIGGAGSFWGVVIAGILMVALPEALRFSNEFRMVLYGFILIAVMLGMPRGVAGFIADRRLAALRAQQA